MQNRQKEALEYAKKQILESVIAPFVKKIVLFGSCARGEEDYRSDVDLLLILDPQVRKVEHYSRQIHYLKGIVSTDEMEDAETDLKVVIGDDWESDSSTFFSHIREEGIAVWQ